VSPDSSPLEWPGYSACVMLATADRGAWLGPSLGQRTGPDNALTDSEHDWFGRVMPSRLSNISLDSAVPQDVADFWCAVLGWQIVEQSDEGVSIAATDGAWPVIDFLPVPETKSGRIQGVRATAW
jgi:hypothetical protein